MNYIYITYYTFIRGIRDWKYMLMILAAPLITTLLVGSVSDNGDKANDIIKTRVAYYSEDNNFIGKNFEQLINSEQIGKSFDIKRVSSLEEGNVLIKGRSTDAFIYISSNTSDAINRGENAEILVMSSGVMSPATILAQGFSHQVNALTEAGKLTGQIKFSGPGQFTESIALSPMSKVMSGVSKWSYLTLLMYIFYGCMISSMSFLYLEKMNINKRLDSAPVGKFTKSAGILSGNSIVLLSAEILFMVITKIVLGARWDNIPFIAVIFVLYSIICSSFGCFLASIFKNTGICVLIVVCVNILFGNSMATAAIGAENSILKYLYPVNPSYQGYIAITESIYQGNNEIISGPVITLAIMALVLTFLAVYTGRRKTA